MGILDQIQKAASRIVPRFVPPSSRIVPAVKTPAIPSAGTYGLYAHTIPDRTPLDLELGVTGLRQWFGRVSDTEEYELELQGERGKRMFDEMSRSDPTISSGLWLLEQMIKQTPWTVKPVDDTPEQIERAEFLESCLADMYVSWDETLSEIMTMTVYGFSVFEPVMKVRRGPRPGAEKDASGSERTLPPSKFNDGRIGWHKIAPRAQEYIFRWLIDDKGEVVGIVQWAPPTWQQIVIPYEKLIHFKTVGRRHNPEGNSLLRGCYRPYRMLKEIEENEGIGIERDLCGVPFAEIDEEILRRAQGAGTDESSSWARAMVETIKKIVTRVKMDEQAGIVFPLAYDDNGKKLYEFSLLSASGSRVIDTTKVIDRKKQEIASAFLAGVLLLGHNSVGSYALSETSKSLLFLGANGILNTIEETMNRKAIPQLMEANGFEPSPGKMGFPALDHGDVEQPDIEALGKFIGALAMAGFNVATPEIQRYLFGIANIPIPQQEA